MMPDFENSGYYDKAKVYLSLDGKPIKVISFDEFIENLPPATAEEYLMMKRIKQNKRNKSKPWKNKKGGNFYASN